MFWRLRARLGYQLARQLFHWRWLMQQPRAWTWMQGQFARMAAQGDVPAQSFYGHLLLFRGQGFGARLSGDARQAPDGAEAARWWTLAAQVGHPLAAHRLARLYREGAPGLAVDAVLAQQFERRASDLGLG